MEETNYLDIALQYHAAGFRCIPVNSKKRPYSVFAKYRESQTEDDIRELFGRKVFGIAILTGLDGIEVIDVDCKYDLTGSLMYDYMRAADETLQNLTLIDLTITHTMHDGYHVMYKAPEIEPNQRLAMRNTTIEERTGNPNDKQRVLIETRGAGGYIIVAPTPGYNVEFGSLLDIPTITAAQRNALLSSARTFNQVKPAVIEYTPKPQTAVNYNYIGKTSWDDYNERGDVMSLLLSHGWKFVREETERIYLQRPGETENETSANFHKGHRTLNVFTTSTQFPSEKPMTPATVFKILECNGDSSESARRLYAMGYGDRPSPECYVNQQAINVTDRVISILKTQEQISGEAAEKLRSSFIDMTCRPPEEQWNMFIRELARYIPLAAPEMLILVSGMEKSRKTTFLQSMVASALSGDEILGFSVRVRNKKIIWIDTEQTKTSAYRTQTNMLKLAGLDPNTNHPNYAPYYFREYGVQERIDLIEHIISTTPDIGMFVIDGALDLIQDFNDVKQAAYVTQKILEWTAKSKAIFLVVIHTTKSNNYTAGHLGSTLNRKCDASFRLSLEDGGRTTKVEHVLSRNKTVAPFYFTLDDEGKIITQAPEGTSAPSDWTDDSPNKEEERTIVSTVAPQPQRIPDEVLPF